MKIKEQIIKDLHDNMLLHKVTLAWWPSHQTLKKLINWERTCMKAKDKFIIGYSKVKNKNYNLTQLFDD